MPDLTVKPFTSAIWPEFEALFGKHKGVRGGCWCVFNRCTSSKFDKMSRDERKAFHQSLVKSSQELGLIVFDGETPVAWCQFGPAEGFPRYDRGRAYSKLEIAPQDKPQWRISCLFVDKHRRGEGLSTFALGKTVDRIRERGGGVVEAFPFDIPGAKRPSYCGSIEMFERHGFKEIARLGTHTVLMRCYI